jgi:hypothetical protein
MCEQIATKNISEVFQSVDFAESPQPAAWHAMWCSGVAKQRHETEVHVLLDMAVKQCEARLVGDRIHCGASKCGNNHRILLDAGRRLAVELHKLKQVPNV